MAVELSDYIKKYPLDWQGRWHGVYLLLGLDCALPFWEDMGLKIESSKKAFVQSLARIAFDKLAKGCGRYECVYSEEEAVAVFEEFKNSIQHKDAEVFDVINEWCYYHYYETAIDGAIEFTVYGVLFYYKNYSNNPSYMLELDDEIIRRLFEGLDRLAAKTVMLFAEVEKSMEPPWSEWDERNFTHNEYHDCEMVNIAIVCDMIRHTYFKRFWFEFIETMSKRDMDILLKFLKRFAKATKRFPMEYVKLPEKKPGWT